jgi:hypothetical protein
MMSTSIGLLPKHPSLLTPYPGKDFTAFGDEAIDPRSDNRERYRAELEHGIAERAEPRSSNARSRAASKNYRHRRSCIISGL